MKKKISMLLVLTLITSFLVSNTAFAANTNLNYEQESYIIDTTDSGEEIIVQPAGVGAVLVFVGGILAGYIIDGVLIKTTGFSGGEWVAKALSFNKKNKSCTNITILSSGKAVCHSGSRGKF